MKNDSHHPAPAFALLDRPAFTLRRRVFTIFGAKLEVFDPEQNVVAFVKQKAFKLREDIRLYADESMERELMLIQARQIIDFAAQYDVIDLTEASREVLGNHIGVLRRRGLKSMIRDNWEILSPDEEPLAELREDHLLLSLVRRFVTDLVPQSFSLFWGEDEFCRITQNFNPFVRKLRVYLPHDGEIPIDIQLIVATAVILLLIEGRQ